MDKEKVIKFIEYLIGESNKYMNKSWLSAEDALIVANDFNRLKYETLNSDKLNEKIKEKIENIKFDKEEIERGVLKYIKRNNLYARIIPYYEYIVRMRKPHYEDEYVRGMFDQYRLIFNRILIEVHNS